MTGQDIFEMASAFLYERDNEDPDSKEFALQFLNVLLEDALPVENSIRRYKGETELDAAPFLSALTDDVPYSASITRGALPHGLAAYFFEESGDNYRGNLYRNLYEKGLAKASKYNLEPIEDVYIEILD